LKLSIGITNTGRAANLVRPLEAWVIHTEAVIEHGQRRREQSERALSGSKGHIGGTDETSVFSVLLMKTFLSLGVL
jgi:hypothetical protein